MKTCKFNENVRIEATSANSTNMDGIQSKSANSINMHGIQCSTKMHEIPIKSDNSTKNQWNSIKIVKSH
jgi:hypothetical protein